VQDIEPYFGWRDFYRSEDDVNSPLFGAEYSEFEYTNKVYNYLLHPQWDAFGSETLLLKVLYVDYDEKYMIIEFIGEWNDAINNDIMFLKRDFLDEFIDVGIKKFILIGENVLNYHSSDDSYYEELWEDLEEGWAVMLNFLPHVSGEMHAEGLENYLFFNEEDHLINWRGMKPEQVFSLVESDLPKWIHD
jgi:hypothetical protein